MDSPGSRAVAGRRERRRRLLLLLLPLLALAEGLGSEGGALVGSWISRDLIGGLSVVRRRQAPLLILEPFVDCGPHPGCDRLHKVLAALAWIIAAHDIGERSGLARGVFAHCMMRLQKARELAG